MIADRIRQARLAAGLTLGALGEQVGVLLTLLSQKYEKGLLTPSLRISCSSWPAPAAFGPILLSHAYG